MGLGDLFYRDEIEMAEEDDVKAGFEILEKNDVKDGLEMYAEDFEPMFNKIMAAPHNKSILNDIQNISQPLWEDIIHMLAYRLHNKKMTDKQVSAFLENKYKRITTIKRFVLEDVFNAAVTNLTELNKKIKYMFPPKQYKVEYINQPVMRNAVNAAMITSQLDKKVKERWNLQYNEEEEKAKTLSPENKLKISELSNEINKLQRDLLRLEYPNRFGGKRRTRKQRKQRKQRTTRRH